MKLLPSLLALLSLGLFASAQETPKLNNEPSQAARPVGKAQKIFNGKDLDGWAGNEELWSVKDGAIVGETKPDKPIKHNTFLVWTDGQVENFELTFKYRLTALNEKKFANSGVQYRSHVLQPGENGPIVAGYQADMENGDTYSGILYEEKGRGILAKRGEKTEITADPADPNKAKVTVVGTLGDSKEMQAKIKKADWNEYRVVVQGKHIQHFINGMQTVDVTDNHAKAAQDGILALQLHAGGAMKVEFKDIELTELK